MPNLLRIKTHLRNLFKHVSGNFLNLDDPKTFNEKLQWLKINYHDPLLTTCADKYTVRQWIKGKIGEEYLVPLIGSYNHPDEIDFQTLPSQFALKVNWGSGQNIICPDKTKLDIKKTKEQLAHWIEPDQNLYHRFYEWCYKDIKHKIICEEFLKGHSSITDYKFFCFNGAPKILFTCTERESSLKVDFFDLDWNHLPFTRYYPNSEKQIQRPTQLAQMIEVAKELAQEFPFVRVDLYEHQKKVKFSELTFHPGTGVEFFDPPQWDRTLGDMLELPQPKVDPSYIAPKYF